MKIMTMALLGGRTALDQEKHGNSRKFMAEGKLLYKPTCRNGDSSMGNPLLIDATNVIANCNKTNLPKTQKRQTI
eukprot:12705007-Ditylum_brightwellii.AAC.1